MAASDTFGGCSPCSDSGRRVQRNVSIDYYTRLTTPGLINLGLYLRGLPFMQIRCKTDFPFILAS